ncbi:putative Ig domain-containing protein [Paractinoplanes durhamensis]|uniref:Uncharacterized protein n=1 Tax=Paractinoplanes durhamensis TaxID=113563 RepID=A0ABQ3ZDV0_9ACTN|nr:putative Ig domain-containing protein [Actinoplanes durhamensis]GIE07984.1 hypothetical protein Adu01nite_93340 [Actinoplanes durhamensis]
MPVRKTGDDGFTLIEVLVSIAIVCMVMLSLTSFFVVTLRVNQQQGNRQIAVQTAEDAMERARALQVSSMLTGRDLQSSQDQRTNAITKPAAAIDRATFTSSRYVPGISNVLYGNGAWSALVVPYDTAAKAAAGAGAVLPTSPLTNTINGVVYQQYWFFEVCYRVSDTADTSGKDAACTSLTGTPGSTDIPMYRVIVAVTWPDKLCELAICSYISYSLIGQKTEEPVFNTSIPQIAPPGDLQNDVGLVMSYTFKATGGTDPLKWSITGLPNGLTMVATTGVVTGTPNPAGTYSTTVTVVDAIGNKDIASFTWTINKAPSLTKPGTITSPGGVAVNQAFTVTGGSTPFTWTATGTWGTTGLPTGLTMDPETGVVTGTPTRTGSNPVVLTITDKYGLASSQTFTWTVPPLTVSTSTAKNFKMGTAITPVQIIASGGITPYVSYAAANLPAGLTVDTATGIISGTPTAVAGASTVTFTVTDTAGTTATTTAAWLVTP